MGSRERLVLRIVLFLVQTFLREKYRLMDPGQLNRVVDDYLAELKKLGVQLVYSDPNLKGETDEQLSASDKVS